MNIVFANCPNCNTKNTIQLDMPEDDIMTIQHINLNDMPKEWWRYVNKNAPFECLNCGSKFNIRFVKITVPQPTLIEE